MGVPAMSRSKGVEILSLAVEDALERTEGRPEHALRLMLESARGGDEFFEAVVLWT